MVWINSHLEGRNLKVADLERDLVDGVKLVNLIELLSGSISQMLFFGGGGLAQLTVLGIGKKIRHNRNPRMKAHKADNHEMALETLNSLGISTIGYNCQGWCQVEKKGVCSSSPKAIPLGSSCRR